LVFDGTYFHKNGCLLILMDVPSQTVIFNAYVDKEGYYSVYPFLSWLKEHGLNPLALTIDGHHTVIRAFKEVWPHLRIQRCLYHIQREGLRWLRTFPKTQAGRDLRMILRGLHRIKSEGDRQRFLDAFELWERTHKTFVRLLPSTSVAFKDLKKTRSLVRYAIPNMFHYLGDPKIMSTTNLLEGFFSRLKADFRRHRGLSETHKRAYLQWYCYFKN
jgi:transposase-like protein